MRKTFMFLGIAMTAGPAFAQSTAPSEASIIQALHDQLRSEQDQLTIVSAKLLDAEQQIAALQDQLAKKGTKPQDPTSGAKGKS